MAQIEFLQPEGLLRNPGFSQAVVASGTRTVYVSGQVAVDAQGNLVGGNDLAAQLTQAMNNLRTALTEAGATLADVVKLTTYVVNYRPEQRAVIGVARAPFFEGLPRPASTLVGVAALALPEWLVEVDAVAVLG